MEPISISTVWIGLSILILSMLYVAYLIEKDIDYRKSKCEWYLYDRERHVMISGPYTKAKAESMLKLYIGKKEYQVKRSKDGRPGKDKRRFTVIVNHEDWHEGKKYATYETASEFINKCMSEGLQGKIVIRASRFDIIVALIKVIWDTCMDIVANLWKITNVFLKACINLLLGSIKTVVYLIASISLGVLILLLSLTCKSLRDDIKRFYYSEQRP